MGSGINVHNVHIKYVQVIAVSEFGQLSVDSIASTGHTPINKIRGSPEDGENTSGKKHWFCQMFILMAKLVTSVLNTHFSY